MDLIYGNMGCQVSKRGRDTLLKTVVFIPGKKNSVVQNVFIRFSIEYFIANISLYELSWIELNFGHYLTFEIIF